jgi:hypothetical protein
MSNANILAIASLDSQLRIISNYAKLITVIAIEAKQSQPLRLLHFASLREAAPTLHSQ